MVADVAQAGDEHQGNKDTALSHRLPSSSPAGIAFAIAADWPAQACMLSKSPAFTALLSWRRLVRLHRVGAPVVERGEPSPLARMPLKCFSGTPAEGARDGRFFGSCFRQSVRPRRMNLGFRTS